MARRRWWKALSDLDTALGWAERLFKPWVLIVTSSAAGAFGIVLGVVEDLPLASLFLLGLSGFGLVIVFGLYIGRMMDQWLLERRRNRPITLKERVVAHLKEGRDFIPVLQQARYVPDELEQALMRWAREAEDIISARNPGTAILFITEFPRGEPRDYANATPREFLEYLGKRFAQMEVLVGEGRPQ